MQFALLFEGDFLLIVESPQNVRHETEELDQEVVRVYTNIHGNKAGSVKACLAGQMAKLRLELADDASEITERVIAIEIPLKSAPNCIAVEGTTPNFAIAIQNQVLIYALCSKRVSGSSHIFK